MAACSFVCWVSCNWFSLGLQLVRKIPHTETWLFQLEFAKCVYVFNCWSFTFVRNLKTLRSSTGLVKSSFRNRVENVSQELAKNFAQLIQTIFFEYLISFSNCSFGHGKCSFDNRAEILFQFTVFFDQDSEQFGIKKNFLLVQIAPLFYSTNWSKNASDTKTFFKELGSKWIEEVIFSRYTLAFF